MEKLVDCIVPSNDVSDETVKTLASLRGLQFIRVLLILDKNTVVCEHILRKIHELELDITIICNSYEKGLPGTLNTGLEHSTNKFVMRLDDGDENIHKNLLYELNNWDAGIDLKCFDMIMKNSENDVGILSSRIKYVLGTLSPFARVPHPTWLVLRSAISQKYRNCYKRCEDYGFLCENRFRIGKGIGFATRYDCSNRLNYIAELQSSYIKAMIFVNTSSSRFGATFVGLVFICIRFFRLSISTCKYFSLRKFL